MILNTNVLSTITCHCEEGARRLTKQSRFLRLLRRYAPRNDTLVIASVLVLTILLNQYLWAEEMKSISLPEPKTEGTISLEEAISLRRSKRSFLDKNLSLEEISQLLWACQGITDKRRGLRSAPSAGATYPLEVFLLNKEGLFRYNPDNHSLERILDKDIRQELSDAALGQGSVRDAPVNIVICAIFERTAFRYGRRAQQYVFIEAGHAAQNIHLQAVSLGLGSVPIGAFDDNSVKEVLKLKDPIRPIYIIPVGYTRD